LISLPRKWALKYGIKKGDELEINEIGAKLTVETSSIPVPERVVVNFDQFSPLTAKCALDVLHKAGYGEIEISYTDKTVYKAISDRLLQLIGCDVVEQTDKKVVIKDITKGSLESEFDSLFRRTFLITVSMAKNGLNSVKKGNFSEVAEFASTESTNNKLVNYCHRILTKKGHKDPHKMPLYFVVLWYLESLADDLRDMLTFIATKKGFKISKECVGFYGDVVSYLDLFFETFYKYNTEGGSHQEGGRFTKIQER